MVCIPSLDTSSPDTKPHHTATSAIAGALLFAGLLASAGANADDAAAAATSAKAPKTENCLPVNRIRHTKVVDDQTVLFYMPQNQIYKNVLPNKCNLLGSYKAIYYKPTGNQLCSVDAIGPLITDQPSMSRATCGLGTFELIDKATAEKLLSDAKAR